MIRRYSVLLFSAVCLFSASSLFSQGKNSEFAREIVIEESGIHAISMNDRDTIVIDLTNNAVIYGYPEGTESFWYKIYAKKDCEISFEIFPAAANNRYNYFLYKRKEDLSISDIKTQNIIPIRANLFVEEMVSVGTGLSRNVPKEKIDTSDARLFYHTAYHGSVPALAGDVLMLNIYHLKGEDCGQQFVLMTNNQSQKFQSLYKECFESQISSVKTERVINLRTPPKVIPKTTVDQVLKATYVAWDSIKRSRIEPEIIWTKKKKNSYTTLKGAGDIVLEKNTFYAVSFSAIGYRSKNISFLTSDTLASFTRYIFLTPVREGENFSMEKIYFYPNTFAMRPEAASELNKLLKYLKSNTETRIEIQGFTNGNNRIKASQDDMSEGSFTGSAKKLSQMRAEKIKEYLTENGISEDRLIANGYGGSRMIYPDPKNQEEANKNIRVGIQILLQKDRVYFGSSAVKK